VTAPSAGASSFVAVLAAVRRGQTVGAAARSLGIAVDLAEAMLDEAKRLGLAASAREACGTCSAPVLPASCLGCPAATRPGV
jgi:hypothetical protein